MSWVPWLLSHCGQDGWKGISDVGMGGFLASMEGQNTVPITAGVGGSEQGHSRIDKRGHRPDRGGVGVGQWSNDTHRWPRPAVQT